MTPAGACGRLLALAVALLLPLAACGGGSDSTVPAAVRVFAAASLSASFEELAAAFERAHAPVRVELQVAGSPQLVLQLRNGAAADVFAAADMANMEKVRDSGLCATAPIEFARNEMAIVVGAGNPKRVQGLVDLSRAGLKVALCAPEVPAGRYARQLLAAQQLAVHSVSDEPNVTAVVSKVQLGELDAGIVYATDCRGRGVEAVPLPAAQNIVASYPIAALRAGGNAQGGEAFVAFVASGPGRAILQRHGFLLP